MKTRQSALFLVALLAACSESEPIQPQNGLKGFGSELPRFAVHVSDYTSSSVSFLDGEGEVLVENWLHSGSQLPSLVEPLSGDIAFATEERGDGTFTIIDKFGTDVVSRFDLASGALLGQSRVRDAFSVNAHDVIFTQDGRAFVLRYGRNLDAGAPAFDRGGDLLEIDPVSGAPLGLEDGSLDDYRIDLSEFEQPIQVDSEATLNALASPSSGVEVRGFLVIGLARFTPGFEASATGAIVVADPDTKKSELHEFEGVTGCESVSRVPGSAAKVLVRCQGYFGSDEEDRAAMVLEIDAEGGVREIASLYARDMGGPERPFDAAVAISDRELIAVDIGDYFSETDLDVVYHVSLEDGSVRELLRSSLGGALAGRMAYDAASGLVLIPDTEEGVRRLRVKADGGVEILPTVPVGLGMGARGIALVFD